MRITIVFFILTFSLQASCQKEVKVFFAGLFSSKESFIISYDNRIVKKIKNAEGYYSTGFKIIVDTTNTKHYDFLQLNIYKKNIWGYKDTEISIFYQDDRKYLYIYNDVRMKKKYMFNYRWFNNPDMAGIPNTVKVHLKE